MLAFVIYFAIIVGAGVGAGHLGEYVGLEAPWWAWSLLVGIAIGLGWALRFERVADARRKELRDERYELQFWDSTFSGQDSYHSQRLHFPSQLMREDGASGGDITFWLYFVRRSADGIWERRLVDGASILMNRRLGRIIEGLAPDDHSRDDEFDAEATTWNAFASGGVEIAYQRFIHAQDVPIIDNVYDAWKKDADKAEERERKRDERRSAPTQDGAETKSA